MNTTSKRGGARPGAGRPLQGTGRKTPATFMLSPEGAAARQMLRERGRDINTAIDNFIRTLAESEKMTTFVPYH